MDPQAIPTNNVQNGFVLPCCKESPCTCGNTSDKELNSRLENGNTNRTADSEKVRFRKNRNVVQGVKSIDTSSNVVPHLAKVKHSDGNQSKSIRNQLITKLPPWMKEPEFMMYPKHEKVPHV